MTRTPQWWKRWTFHQSDCIDRTYRLLRGAKCASIHAGRRPGCANFTSRRSKPSIRARAERSVRVARVALIQTGGTIDSVGTDRLDLAWYTEARQRLAPGDLVARVPELGGIASVEEVAFRRLSSHALTDADWLELRGLVQLLLEDAFDGVVITHGTNTLEETAYFLSLTVRSDKPVVLVGSMRPASGLGADGYLNLLNAVRVAADPAARGHGTLVVLDDTIHAARDV